MKNIFLIIIPNRSIKGGLLGGLPALPIDAEPATFHVAGNQRRLATIYTVVTVVVNYVAFCW